MVLPEHLRPKPKSEVLWCTCGQRLARVHMLGPWGKSLGVRGFHCTRCGYQPLKQQKQQ